MTKTGRGALRANEEPGMEAGTACLSAAAPRPFFIPLMRIPIQKFQNFLKIYLLSVRIPRFVV